MDGSQASFSTVLAEAPLGRPRSFLFLQGPISTFFDRLGRALIARGHRVHRVNIHLGDQLFWRLPATQYRGRFEDWRAFVGDILDRHQITDLVLHGDRRPYHIVAAEEARARGIPVFATDLGYVRPDWITLEYDGMTTFSRFPRDPAAIRALAAEFPEPDLTPRYHTPFRLIAGLDIAYNLGLVFGRPLFPHYRYHSVCHPFAEYAGWVWSRVKQVARAQAAAAAKQRLQAAPGSYFLVPLQLATDFQIRAHSPFRDVREAVREIVASFAASGSSRELVIVVHPLDNGLVDWTRHVGRLARALGIAERVTILHGGTPSEILINAAGVVTINSTIGVTALHHGVPVKVLGQAVFDVPGLTCQSPLEAFWHEPVRPDAALMTAFLRALAGTTQVKGGYYTREAQARAIAAFVERFEAGLYPLPPVSPGELALRAARPNGQTVVVAGVSDEVGLALARGYAGPGVTLCLVGADPRTLRRAAEDCRQRGAVVATFRPDRRSAGSVETYLSDLAAEGCIDALVVHADPGAIAAGPEVGGDLLAAMEAVGAVAPAMCRQGRGEIVLVGGVLSRTPASNASIVKRARNVFLAYGALLRRRLCGEGVSVVVVAPGTIAARLAKAFRDPALARIGAERLAGLVLRGIRRRRQVIAFPAPITVIARTIKTVPAKVGGWIGATILPTDPVRPPVGEDALHSEAGSAD